MAASSRPRSLTFLLALALSGCGSFADQLDAANVNGCIKQNCTTQEASAYQQCEATCRKTYGH